MSLLLVLKSAASDFAGTPALSGSGTLSTGTALPGVGGLATKNWATNPSSETSSAGTGTNGTLTQSTTQAFVGTNSTRLSATATSARSYTGEHVNISAAVGDVVTVSIYVYSSVGFTPTLSIIGYTSADVSLGAIGNGGSTTVPANTWTRLTATTTLNAFLVGSDLSKVAAFLNLPAGSVADLFYFDACQVTKNSALGAPIPYFDGSTTDTGTDLYTWDGAAHASTSTWVVGAGVPAALSGDGTLGATGAIPSAGASFVGSNQIEGTPVAGNTLLVPYPTSGIQNGDIALFYFSNTVAVVPPDHSGWTTIKKGSSVGDTVQPTHYVGWRYCNGTENGTSYTMTTGNNNHIAGISVFRNVDPTHLQFTFTEIGAGSTTTMTGITTPAAGSVLFSLVALNSTAATVTSFGSTPTAFTEVMDRVSGARSAAAAYAIWSGSGATGSPVATWSGSARSLGVFVALPVAVPTTGIRLVNSSRTEPTAGGASPVLEVPSGTALNDLMIAEFSYNNASVMGAQSGWTQLEGASTTAFGVTAFWRFATASEPASYTFALGFSGRYSAGMAVYRGVDLVTVEDVASSAAVGTTSQAAYTATTPVTAGAVVLAIGGHLTGVGEVRPDWSSSNMSVAVQNTSQVPAQAETSGAIAHAAWTSGAFTPTLTSDLTMTRSISITAVLRPAATGTSFSGTATLSGSGDLTSVQIPRPVVTAALSGDGTLSTTQAPRPVVTTALSGDGILTTVQIPRPVVTTALSGSGTLSSTQVPRPAPSAALSGSGTLVAAGVAVIVAVVAQDRYRWYADGGVGDPLPSESGSPALAATNTAYGADLTLADMNLSLRMRLQETNGVDVPAGDDWQLQWENNASGTWIDVSPEPAQLVRYPASNHDGTYNNLTNANWLFGQSFLGDGQTLTTAHFYLLRQGNAVGTLRAVLYAHTGTFGSGGVGSGIPMVTSYGIDAATIPNTAGGGPAWQRFDFPSNFVLSNGGSYVIAIYNDTSGDSGNRIQAALDSSAPTAPGNQSQNTTGSWVASTNDMIFEVRTAPGTPTSVTANNSANLTDAAVTTQRLGAGSGSFVPGRVSVDGLANNLSVTQGWTGGNYTEVLYSLTLRKYNLASSDTLRFRVVDNDATTIQTYPQTPTINVTIGTGFAATVGFSGDGTLSTTAAPGPVVTAALSGDGTLTSVQIPRPTVSTALSGSGDLTTTQTPRPAVASALSGAGTLSTTQVLTTSGTATLSGSGALTTVQTPGPVISAALSGSGTLAAVGAAIQTATGTATLTGSGTLTTTQTPRPVVTAALSGDGVLTTVQIPRSTATVALTGSGSLTTTQIPAFAVTSAFSGAGTLSVTVLPSVAVTASLSGSGTLTSAGVPGLTVLGALSGSGTLSAVGVAAPTVVVSLSGSGTLATTQTPRPIVTAALSGSGTLTTVITLTTTGIAVLSGSGTLAALRVYDLTTVEWGDSATGTGWTNPANAIGPDDATYAFWTSSTASAVSPPLEVGFGDFATVPSDASNISVRVRVKGYWS